MLSYNGHIEVNSSLLDADLRDKPELKEDDYGSMRGDQN
jgi:hypothetical protein